ncbi:FMN-dependent NADH-azoreductase [Terriglobus roseus]|uniref:FMN dependent NADH:quinone oxidoreductase n=1 Tax=Terriglobus roseus TaxID=392734 RepID=A0A1H4PYA6_9BACT|nr:NAD(P)H-dependent oxidoreductase [Terriglobus roseus]SEC12162.1 FMN-dependent NADH-azoreductase [Terriglobus roseus]
MSTLLALDVSPRGDRSISRALGKHFVGGWQALNPDGTVIYRDLNASRIPYMDNDWIGGVYAPAEVERTPEMHRALALSAELIAELQAADVLFISTPMYNFTIPAVLKSWLDYVVRPGYTFQLAPGWPGMLKNKRAKLIVVSRDSYEEGQPTETEDHVTPVLRKVLSFMGINELDVVRAGGSLAVNLGKVRLEDHLKHYAPAVAALAGS